ncbi:MAG: ATP-binding protein [Chitinophagaceae bacterium]|nr:ATP-binding protein [Chitinophagaceae bacterium]
MVNADIEKTAPVLIANFLTNAIKFSPENSRWKYTPPVKKKNAAEFIVKDDEKEFDNKYLPKIFDRYFKVPGSSKTFAQFRVISQKELIEAIAAVVSWCNKK